MMGLVTSNFSGWMLIRVNQRVGSWIRLHLEGSMSTQPRQDEVSKDEEESSGSNTELLACLVVPKSPKKQCALGLECFVLLLTCPLQ